MARHGTEDDWVARFADEVVAASERRAPGHPVVVASGLSPSGPIHLGNLREVMTPHLVADEVRRRGVPCVHILSWDDYDRFRRVPAGIDPSWSEHIGKPLSSVPAPEGSADASWAEHFKAPMLEAARRLGIEFVGISQTERYTSGAYATQVLHAMRLRRQIDAVLARHRTKPKVAATRQEQQSQLTESEQVAARAAVEGSGAADEDDGSAAGEYYPYKPYCAVCGRDTTTITSYDDATTLLHYVCACGHEETVDLSTDHRGKLVWKVDWPMRWAYEGVIFEPSGVDHQSPGSSFVVGGELVKEVFGGEQPIGPMYAFVGISGMAKMSSSRGSVPTPLDALEIMEPEVLRWLYARRKPQQSFTIAFDQEIYRLYDEWDALGRKVLEGTATASQSVTHARALHPGTGRLPRTVVVLPYRTLASVADITTGDASQMLRILGELDPEHHPLVSLDEVRPRLDCAQAWVLTEMPAEERTSVRERPDIELLSTLTTEQQESIAILLERLDQHWSLDGLTALVYAVPKLQAGLEMDAQPTPEIKVAQRQFFALLYHLLVGRDSGPRLPTLLLAIGSPRILPSWEDDNIAGHLAAGRRLMSSPHEELLARHRTVMPSWLTLYYDQPLELVRGDGRHVVDGEGRTYLDFFGGILTTSVGHNVPEVVEAIREQAGRMLHSSTLYLIRPMIELAERIAQLSTIPDAKVFFVNSGTEAVETAVLLACGARSSNQVLAVRHGYHGRSFGTMSVTGNRAWSASSLSPLNVSYVQSGYRLRHPLGAGDDDDLTRACVADLREVIETTTAGDVACMIAEPIQGVGGFIVPPDGFFGAVKEVLDEYGILFVSDEVQTAWGRTGDHFWGFQAHRIVPDMATFAKGLGNGLAIGGVVGRAEIIDAVAANSISTFGGNPLAAAGALANLDYLVRHDLQGNARVVGRFILGELESRATPLGVVGEVRGRGLMIGVELVEPGTMVPNRVAAMFVLEACRRVGLLIGAGGLRGNVLRIAPAMSVTMAEAAEAVEVLVTALASADKEFAERGER